MSWNARLTLRAIAIVLDFQAMMSIGNQFFMFYAVALLRFTMPTYLQVGLSLSPSETGLAMLVRKRFLQNLYRRYIAPFSMIALYRESPDVCTFVLGAAHCNDCCWTHCWVPLEKNS